MNVTYPQTRAPRKLPILTVAMASTALVIAAGVGVWQATGSPSPSGQVIRTSLPLGIQYPVRDTRTLVLYLVTSQEQEDMVRSSEEQAASERASAGIPDPHYVLAVLNTSTPKGEDNVREILEAWSTAPGGVHLVDLRGE